MPMPGATSRYTLLVLLASALALGAPARAGAQLASTPWPMFQRDERHTGRSAFLGPLFPAGAPAAGDVRVWPSFGKITSSPTLGADGTIYFGVDVLVPGTSGRGYICALDPDLIQKWCSQLRADASQSTPAVGQDGTIYLGDRDNTVDAVRPDGSFLWYYNHGFEGDVYTSPAIGPDRTIYVGYLQNLYGAGVVTALNPDGSLKWKYVIGRYIDASSPALDTRVSPFALYVGDVNGGLHKFLDNGATVTRPWKQTVGTKITAAPVIGADGTVYVGSTNGLSALRPSDGLVLWNLNVGIVDQTPALGADGTVYFGAKSGLNRALYAVAPDGALRWQYGPVVVSSPYGGFPVVGADGVVYAGFGTGVYAWSPDGVLLWSHPVGAAVSSFPAIAGTASVQDGGQAVLYVASVDQRLHAISSLRHGIATNAAPTADAGPDRSATVGQVVDFAAAASDGDADVLSYTWTFGDGASAIGPAAHHAYVAAGSFPVTLTVSDGLTTATDALTVSIGAGEPAAPFADLFDRPDSASVGNGWQEAQGDLGIKLNELRNAPLKATHIAVQPALSGLTHAAAASFASVDNNAAPRLGVVLRYVDPLNYYLFYRQMGGTSQLRIARVRNGVETVLVSAGVPQATVNAFFRLAADATGNKLTLKLCAATDATVTARCAATAQTLTATDAALAGGSVGVLIGTGTGVTQQYRVDKFAAEVK